MQCSARTVSSPTSALRTERQTKRSHHINTVNALMSRFRAFMQPFCGPASKTLAAYGRWHRERSNADRPYLNALMPLFA